jgi:hypothetical protein
MGFFVGEIYPWKVSREDGIACVTAVVLHCFLCVMCRGVILLDEIMETEARACAPALFPKSVYLDTMVMVST